MRTASFARAVVAIFLFHLGATLALGYLVLPAFQTIDGPSSAPAWGSLLALAARIFYFPLLSWAIGALVTGFARPAIWLAIPNSLVVASFFAAVFFLARPRKRAVA